MLPDVYTDPLVGAYYLATRTSRRRALAADREARRAPILSVFYHRVADDRPNPWTISTRRFKDQIEWIRQRYEVISLVEAQTRIGSRAGASPAVAITFDDGYADNCREALPWLVAQEIPFTYFVASTQVLQQRPFAHDMARGVPLAPNTPEQIRELAEAGVEIGSHTRTHADLGLIRDEESLYEELIGSKRDIEELTDRAVRYFAFPFGLHGNLSAEAFATAFRAGYWGVCSAYGGYNLPGDDPFHIQRFHGDPGWGRFCNWMTVDPRKRRRTKRFEPGDYRSQF